MRHAQGPVADVAIYVEVGRTRARERAVGQECAQLVVQEHSIARHGGCRARVLAELSCDVGMPVWVDSPSSTEDIEGAHQDSPRSLVARVLLD